VATSESFGRYQLLDVLGRGGVGEVFRAQDSATYGIVAIKVLPPHLTQDPDYLQRFSREMHAAAGLNDPHVVPIHNYGEIEGRLYVDMRLIEGPDLGTLIAAGGRLHPLRAVAIIEQVASALDSAHRVGLVHRDVKPSNILVTGLVTGGDFAYLTDFGIAPTFTGTADPRADIYSLTCVLYESLTGQRPNPGDAPSTICPDLPRTLDAVIARGMAENPEQRYQTATELASAARAALTVPWQAGPPVMVAAARPNLPPPSVGLRLTRYLVALAAVLIGAYLVIVSLAGHKLPAHSIAKEGGTRIRLTALTPDRSTPHPDTLSQAEQIIAARVHGLISGSQVVVDGNSVVVTVPGSNSDELRDIGSTGRLSLRPVLNSIPAQQTPGQPGQQPSDPRKNLAARIAQEKQLRQSTSQGLQFLALQYQATRCGKDDVLAGNDDPTLPLVTCSQDRAAAYLLAPSILGNDQIDTAISTFEQKNGQYVVDLKFKTDAAQTWANYTSTHIGTQVAFTLDSEVVSAPQIREAIPGGRTQISGGNPPFTAETARHLANVLNYRPLPLKFVGSPPETIPPQANSDPTELLSNLLSPPAWVVAAAIGVLLILLCVLLCLSVPRIRSRLSF
jgi:preprotein translocase subunit SecD